MNFEEANWIVQDLNRRHRGRLGRSAYGVITPGFGGRYLGAY